MITRTYNARIGNPNTLFESPGLVLDRNKLGESILLFQEGSIGARSPARFGANLFKFNLRFQLKLIPHKNRQVVLKTEDYGREETIRSVKIKVGFFYHHGVVSQITLSRD